MTTKKILYLDDDDFMQVFFEEYFATTYDITLSDSAENARKVLSNGYVPDALILDLGLPRQKGGEFLYYFKSNQHLKNVPVIILSANEQSKTRIEMLRAGADDYITKPFNPEELALKLEKMLGAEKK